MGHMEIESPVVTAKVGQMSARGLALASGPTCDLLDAVLLSCRAMLRVPRRNLTWLRQDQSELADDSARWVLLKRSQAMVASMALKIRHQDLAS